MEPKLEDLEFSAYACCKIQSVSGDNIKAVARQPFDKGRWTCDLEIHKAISAGPEIGYGSRNTTSLD